MRSTYIVLLVLGVVLPYSQFAPWIGAHGLDPRALWSDLTANHIGTFAWMDVVVTGATVILAAWFGRTRVRWWWTPVVATVLVGPSAGLPLLLLLQARGTTGRND